MNKISFAAAAVCEALSSYLKWPFWRNGSNSEKLASSLLNGRNLPLETKGAIVALWQEKKSFVEIAVTLGISRQTVSKWVKVYQETGAVKRKKGSGRPRITSASQDAHLVKTAETNCFSSAKQLAGISVYRFIERLILIWNFVFVKEFSGLEHISKYTVRRRLAAASLRTHVAARKDLDCTVSCIEIYPRISFVRYYNAKRYTWGPLGH